MAKNVEKLTEIEQIDVQNSKSEHQNFLQSDNEKNSENDHLQTSDDKKEKQDDSEFVGDLKLAESEIQKIDWGDSVIKEQQKLLNMKNVAIILNDLGFVALALSIAIVIGGIVLIMLKIAFVFAIGAVLVFLFIGTIGTILLSDGYKGVWRWLGQVLDNSNLFNFVGFMLKLVPFVSILGFASLGTSIVFNCLSKNQKSVPRLVFSSICMGLLLVSVIIIATGVNVNQ